MKEIIFENKGIAKSVEEGVKTGLRLVSNQIQQGQKTIILEVGFHFGLEEYYVEENVTYNTKPYPETYMEKFRTYKTIKEALNSIEEEFDCKVKVLE